MHSSKRRRTLPAEERRTDQGYERLELDTFVRNHVEMDDEFIRCRTNILAVKSITDYMEQYSLNQQYTLIILSNFQRCSVQNMNSALKARQVATSAEIVFSFLNNRLYYIRISSYKAFVRNVLNIMWRACKPEWVRYMIQYHYYQRYDKLFSAVSIQWFRRVGARLLENALCFIPVGFDPVQFLRKGKIYTQPRQAFIPFVEPSEWHPGSASLTYWHDDKWYYPLSHDQESKDVMHCLVAEVERNNRFQSFTHGDVRFSYEIRSIFCSHRRLKLYITTDSVADKDTMDAILLFFKNHTSHSWWIPRDVQHIIGSYLVRRNFKKLDSTKFTADPACYHPITAYHNTQYHPHPTAIFARSPILDHENYVLGT